MFIIVAFKSWSEVMHNVSVQLLPQQVPIELLQSHDIHQNIAELLIYLSILG